MKRYLSLVVLGGLMGLALSGCDSTPVSQSSPPPVQPSTPTPAPDSSQAGGKQGGKPHGPDTEDHNQKISEIRGQSFTLVVNALGFNLLFDEQGAHQGDGVAREIRDGQIEGAGLGRESYCSFKNSRDDVTFKPGDQIEMTDLRPAGTNLVATSKDRTIVMTCLNVHTAADFRVSDLDRIFGSVAEVQLEPRTF